MLDRRLPFLLFALLSGCGLPTLPGSPLDAGEADAGKPAEDAGSDAGSPDAGVTRYRVTSLVMAASDAGVRIHYSRRCDGPACNGTRIEAFGFDPRALDASTPAQIEFDEPATADGDGEYVGAAASGEMFWAMRESRGEVALRGSLLGGFLPGGGIVSAFVAKAGGTRTTQNTSFGSMVRSSQIAVAPDGTAHALFAAADGNLALLSASSDGGAVTTKVFDGGVRVAAISIDGDQPVVAMTDPTDAGDGFVHIKRQGQQEFVSVHRGVPAAFQMGQTDLRVAVKKQDSIAAVESLKTVILSPRSDESACTALTFDEGGVAYFLHVGPKSAVLYQESGGTLFNPTLLSNDLVDAENKFCALVVEGGRIHLAYSLPQTNDEVLVPTQIVYEQLTVGGVSNVLKTKHDTAKNSVGNIR